MAEATHTPGPHTAVTTDTGIREIHDGTGRLLAYVEGLEDGKDNAARVVEADANHRLYAAAPDLLRACRTVAGEMQAASCSGDSREPSWFDRRIRILRAAIAKATGQTA